MLGQQDESGAFKEVRASVFATTEEDLKEEPSPKVKDVPSPSELKFKKDKVHIKQ